jgi:hypothetical protein
MRYISEPCLYTQRRQPESRPGISYCTPLEVIDINLLFNGQAWIENKKAWLQERIERVIWLWTVPWNTVVRARLLAGCSPARGSARSARAGDGGRHLCYTNEATLPLICDIGCDAPSGAASDDNHVGDMLHRHVWERTRLITAAQVSSEDGPDRREWPELAKDAELQVKPAGQKVSTLPPLRPDQATQPCMLKLESQGEMLTAASVLLDQTLLSAPPRRRRGGRRGCAYSPLAPATMGSGEGGIDSRSVQVTLPWTDGTRRSNGEHFQCGGDLEAAATL